MKKKGQVAIEYLVSYGWALLGLMLLIAVLFSFGAFNVSNNLPERCELGRGFVCEDFFIRPDLVAVYFSHAQANIKSLSAVNLSSNNNNFESCNVSRDSINGPNFSKNGDAYEINSTYDLLVISCSPVESAWAVEGARVNMQIDFNYGLRGDPNIKELSGTLNGLVANP